ncbi:pleckstrin homology-like domain family B member 3 isoform X2 [Protopterus annectens]|uniref:pleckstrin homology-like domain family B member 3 isoform X2 n=1 Tax=Protopterus annectens TaxID=7888 RepID=UPI001CFBE112|nr:pleckstrin homology-like domain family B member 3 isoform X2 [Protopterus annectens]
MVVQSAQIIRTLLPANSYIMPANQLEEVHMINMVPRENKVQDVVPEVHTEEQELESLSSGFCSSPGGCTDSTDDDGDDDEASGTESAQNGDETLPSQPKNEVHKLEEEQMQVVTRITDLEQQILDLREKKAELCMETEMEVALLEAELHEESMVLEREEKQTKELQQRLSDVEQRYLRDKEKEKAKVEVERQKLEEKQNQLSNLKKQLNTHPESVREQHARKIQEESDALEAALKAFDDLEFQQLEKESSLEEERETTHQQIMREMHEHQASCSRRKKKVQTLQNQIDEIKKQMATECAKLSQEKSEVVNCLHTERSRKMELEKSYSEETGGRKFSTNPDALKRQLSVKKERKRVVTEPNQPDQTTSPGHTHAKHDTSPKNSLLEGNGTNSLPRRHSDNKTKSEQRPVSVHGNGHLNRIHCLQEGTVNPTSSDQKTGNTEVPQDLLMSGAKPCTSPSSQLSFSYAAQPCHKTAAFFSSGITSPTLPCSSRTEIQDILEMERRLREAMAKKEELLKAMEAKKKAKEEVKREVMEGQEQEKALVSQQAESSIKESTQESRPHSTTFDLRTHLESFGHNVETCRYVTVTGNSCRGHLTKMGGKIKTWKKRWFVFDGQKRRLAYFADKEETKLKGVIYFQAIEEVYYDHLRSAPKSPNHKLTFCVKTYDRLFYIVAPSDEAMRIWMDVIVTAAENNKH